MIWKDHIISDDGTIIQEGTPLSSENLNSIENRLDKNTNELKINLEHSIFKKNIDNEGIFTIIEMKRNDNTLYCESELFEGTSPRYLKRKETYYKSNGITVDRIVNYKRNYNEDDLLISEVII